MRKANEKRCKATGLEVHRQIYLQHRSQVNMMIKEAKIKLYCNKLTTGDPKTCFTILNSLLKLSAKKLPSNIRISTLCDDFASFFLKKIMLIRDKISPVQSVLDAPLESDLPSVHSHLTELRFTDERELMNKKNHNTVPKKDMLS